MDESISEIHSEGLYCGMFIAIYSEKYSNERPPYIGEIIEVKSDTVIIHWWDGCYRGIWKSCTMREGRLTVPWEEEIHIISHVSLSKRYRLTEKCRADLKELYRKYE